MFCNSKTLLKLYFGTETLEDEAEEINHEIDLLKYESDISKQQIENYMEIIMQDVKY